MSISQDQLIGSKLRGISSGKLSFTTNGQTSSNSGASKVLGNYSKLVVTDKSLDGTNRSFVNGEGTSAPQGKKNYEPSFNYKLTHLNENNYSIDWNWKSLYNTPGSITGTFNPHINGAGSTESNSASYHGVNYIPLTIDQLRYSGQGNNVTDIATNATITMTFPPYEDKPNGIVEVGDTITFNTYNGNLSLPNNASNDIQKKYNGIGIVAYNTPSPILKVLVESGDRNIAKIVNSKGEETDTLILDGGNYTGATGIKVSPNVPVGGTGTIKGNVSLAANSITSNSTGNNISVTCTNDGKEFNIIKPNQDLGKTSKRKTTIKYTYLSQTNNVGGISGSSCNKTITIYQGGGQVKLPVPNLTYSWSTTNSKYLNNFNGNGNKVTFTWKDNSGQKAKVYNTNGKSITFKNNPTNQQDNTGGTQQLELVNFGFDNQVETSSRSTDVYCLVSCNECAEGSQGQITGEYTTVTENGQRKNYLPNQTIPSSATIIGKSSKISLSQNGQSWPDAGISVKIKAKPYSTNPTNVTNNVNIKPVCLVYIDGETPSKNETTVRLTRTSQPKVYLYFNNIQPSPVGASTTGTLTSSPDSLSFTQAGNSQNVTVDANGVTFNQAYVPEMGECKWDIVIESATTDSKVNGTCTVDSTPKTVIVPKNTQSNGRVIPAKVGASINVNYFNLDSSEITLNNTTKKGTIKVTAEENPFNASTATVTDIDKNNGIVSGNITTDIENANSRTGILTLISNTDGVKFGTNIKKTIKLTQSGHTVTGTIDFTATKKSGGNGSFTPKTGINYGDAADVTIGTYTEDGGSFYYKPEIKSFNVPNVAGSKNVSPENSPTITKGSDTVFTVTGTIKSSDVPTGTKVKFNNNNSVNITVDGYTQSDSNSYYQWTFTPAPGVENVTLENANSRIVKINFPKNPKPTTDGYEKEAYNWLLNNGTTINMPTAGNKFTPLEFYSVKGGNGGNQASRPLGTLSLAHTRADVNPDPITVTQLGSSSGPTTATANFTSSGHNCTADINTSISATGTSDITKAKINSITLTSADKADWSGATTVIEETVTGEKELKIERVGIGSTNATSIKTGKLDTETKYTIGCKISGDISLNIPCSLSITSDYDNSTHTFPLSSTISTKISSTSNFAVLEYVWKEGTSTLSKETGSTMTVKTIQTPGTRTYTLEKVKIHANHGGSQDTVVTYFPIGYSWDFIVEGVTYKAVITGVTLSEGKVKGTVTIYEVSNGLNNKYNGTVTGSPKILVIATKAKDNEGSGTCTGNNDISFSNANDVTLGTYTKETSTASFSPAFGNISLNADGSTGDTISLTSSPVYTAGNDTKIDLSATVTTTNPDITTSVSISPNPITISGEAAGSDSADYYTWTFVAAAGVTGVSISKDTAGNTATLVYGQNPNPLNGGAITKKGKWLITDTTIEINDKKTIAVYKVTRGNTGGQASYTLGTLKFEYNNPNVLHPDAIEKELIQPGKGTGNIIECTKSLSITKKVNCTAILDNTIIVAKEKDSDSASVTIDRKNEGTDMTITTTPWDEIFKKIGKDHIIAADAPAETDNIGVDVNNDKTINLIMPSYCIVSTTDDKDNDTEEGSRTISYKNDISDTGKSQDAIYEYTWTIDDQPTSQISNKISNICTPTKPGTSKVYKITKIAATAKNADNKTSAKANTGMSYEWTFTRGYYEYKLEVTVTGGSAKTVFDTSDWTLKANIKTYRRNEGSTDDEAWKEFTLSGTTTYKWTGTGIKKGTSETKEVTIENSKILQGSSGSETHDETISVKVTMSCDDETRQTSIEGTATGTVSKYGKSYYNA